MIKEKDYEKFKEMYDYKRKIEYNKEKIKKELIRCMKNLNLI